jgi:hypothetical protein
VCIQSNSFIPSVIIEWLPFTDNGIFSVSRTVA